MYLDQEADWQAWRAGMGLNERYLAHRTPQRPMVNLINGRVQVCVAVPPGLQLVKRSSASGSCAAVLSKRIHRYRFG